MNKIKWAHCTGVNICLMPSIMSSNSILLFSISSFTFLSYSISYSRVPFCKLRNCCLFWIFLLCSSVRLREFFSYLNHSSISAYFYSSSANKCFFSAALHIMYLWRAGKLKFTICLKYSLIVFILYFPVAPILDLKLSIIEFISGVGSSPFYGFSKSTSSLFINWWRLAAKLLIVLLWETIRS